MLNIFPGSLRNDAKSEECLIASLLPPESCRKRKLKAQTKAAELFAIEKHQMTGRDLSAFSSNRDEVTEEMKIDQLSDSCS